MKLSNKTRQLLCPPQAKIFPRSPQVLTRPPKILLPPPQASPKVFKTFSKEIMQKTFSCEKWMLWHVSCTCGDFACLVRKHPNEWKTSFSRVNDKPEKYFPLFTSKTIYLCFSIVVFVYIIYVNLNNHAWTTKQSPFLGKIWCLRWTLQQNTSVTMLAADEQIFGFIIDTWKGCFSLVRVSSN